MNTNKNWLPKNYFVISTRPRQPKEKRFNSSTRAKKARRDPTARPVKSAKVRLQLDKTSFGNQILGLLPQFKIFVGGKEVGYITTGHAMVFPDFRGQGIFFEKALPQYEAFQSGLFRKGLFETYKQQIIEGMGWHRNREAFASFIRGITTPTHIEFWRLPNIARQYMRHAGYELCEQSIRELEERGLPKSSTKKQIIDFLRAFRKSPHPADVLFVLTKPANISHAVQ